MNEKENGPAPDDRKQSGNASVEDITFDMPTCGGCRTCEMACGFHHRGEFNPEAASLQIIDKDDGPGYRVRIAAQSIEQRTACDLCKGLEVPLCAEYCREVDDLYKILAEFEKRRGKEEGSDRE